MVLDLHGLGNWFHPSTLVVVELVISSTQPSSERGLDSPKRHIPAESM